MHDFTNVNDDGSVPPSGKWKQNHSDINLNNFRQNEQGDIPPTALPDVTSDTLSCKMMDGNTLLSAEVCNRGVKTVGAGLKAAFYKGDPNDKMVLCVATTEVSLDAEQCAVVSCEVVGAVTGEVTVIGNDDGMGGKTTLECIYTNNDDAASIDCDG